MDQALDLLPADTWRWYLMANAPESDDTSFTLEHFASVVNKDLADVLGNFVNRITRFCQSKFGETIPEGAAPGDSEAALMTTLQTRLESYTENLEAMEFRKACADLRSIWVAGNEYLQETAPWTAFKTDPAAAAISVRIGLNLIRFFAVLSAPVIPFTAEKMLAVFGERASDLSWPEDVSTELARLPGGTPFSPPEVLFSKIDDEQLATWRAQFNAE